MLLRRAPNADLLTRLAALRGDPSPLGVAHAALGRGRERQRISSESSANSSICSSASGAASWCLTPLTISPASSTSGRWRACATILRGSASSASNGEAEPEDHAAVLCEIMAGLGRTDSFGAPAGADRALFEKHLAPWIGRFFADLEHAKAADFYRRVGAVGRVFMEIESEAFALAS